MCGEYPLISTYILRSNFLLYSGQILRIGLLINEKRLLDVSLDQQVAGRPDLPGLRQILEPLHQRDALAAPASGRFRYEGELRVVFHVLLKVVGFLG